MHSIRRLSVAILFCWGLLPGIACAEALDWIMAVVNGDIVLYSEVQDRIKLLEANLTNIDLQDPNQRAQFEKEVLRQIIRERLTDQEIKRLKISVDKDDIDRAIEEVKKENRLTDEQFEYVLSQEGRTVDEFREKIRQEMERARLIERVFKSKTVITEEQVDAYLQQGGGAAALPAEDRRRLAVIFLPVAEKSGEAGLAEVKNKAAKIHERLEAGEDFGKLAREYSKGPAADEGGDIGYIASGELIEPIEKATRGLKPGSITEVVVTPGGCYILKALDTRRKEAAGSTLSPADAAAREKARRQLTQEEINRKYEEWIRDLEARSFIQIHSKPGVAGSSS